LTSRHSSALRVQLHTAGRIAPTGIEDGVKHRGRYSFHASKVSMTSASNYWNQSYFCYWMSQCLAGGLRHQSLGDFQTTRSNQESLFHLGACFEMVQSAPQDYLHIKTLCSCQNTKQKRSSMVSHQVSQIQEILEHTLRKSYDKWKEPACQWEGGLEVMHGLAVL
jgi:hypothetical protein